MQSCNSCIAFCGNSEQGRLQRHGPEVGFEEMNRFPTSRFWTNFRFADNPSVVFRDSVWNSHKSCLRRADSLASAGL